MLENERLSTELEKNKSKIDKFDEISVQNQQLKNQINTLNNLQVENNNLKLELEKEKQRSENFKIIGKLYQCMYLHLMNHIIPSVIQKFKIVELIRNGLDNLFTGVLDEYQNKSKIQISIPSYSKTTRPLINRIQTLIRNFQTFLM